MKKYPRFTSAAALSALTLAGLCFAGTVHAADATMEKTKLSAGDKKFVMKAYQGGLTEVEEGRMAKEKAKESATKEVAERMIADHTKANDRLKEIAEEEHLDVSGVKPKAAPAMGDNFDKSYLTMQVKAHEKDIAMFEKEAADAKTGEDRDVPAFARNTLPTLKEHLAMIKDALAKMK